EDGIRDRNVTGVQTCALPIYLVPRAVFPNQDEPKQQARQPTQKRSEQKICLHHRHPVENVGRGVAQHRADGPRFSVTARRFPFCVAHSSEGQNSQAAELGLSRSWSIPSRK